MSFSIFASKTFWGAVAMAAFKIAGDHSAVSIGEAISGVVAVIGARQAIAKNGAGK